MFFCLSGFLITGILLGIKSPAARGKFAGLKSFYIRRALRIFPIYYLTIAIAIAIGYQPARDHAVRFLTYSLNLPGLGLSEGLGALSHFWSLSVEEQFYLFWPLAVLSLPRPVLPKVVLALIGLSLLYKMSFAAVGAPYKMIFFRIPGCIDSLGLGSLLALQHDPSRTSETVRPFVIAGKLGGCLWVAMTATRTVLGIDPFYRGYLPFGVLYFFVSALTFTGLIASALMKSEGLLSRALEHPWAIHLGRISYGVYVYHFIIPYLLGWANGKYLLHMESPWILALLSVGLSLLAAEFSWHWIERPFLSCKQRFQYSVHRRHRK
jgi:peptidoglycan/LPS O-acetylase OafA/YrhL